MPLDDFLLYACHLDGILNSNGAIRTHTHTMYSTYIHWKRASHFGIQKKNDYVYLQAQSCYLFLNIVFSFAGT